MNAPAPPAQRKLWWPGSRRWVDWYAGRITDPVTRLQFLQQVAPRLRFQLFWAKWRLAIVALLALAAAGPLGYRYLHARSSVSPSATPAPRSHVAPAIIPTLGAPPSPALPDVWQVEKAGSSETYSNGLRIDDRFAVSNHPRSYLAFPAGGPAGAPGMVRTQPAGIVFHTTESPQAPFEADQNRVLKRIGESLLEYVRRKRSYHFLIDRFGRVYRVVAESDAANHAGYSVWADDQYLYINLNESFLGISIEADTQPGQEQASMSPAQVRSAAMLTEMLRSKYHLAAQNCVTHAQVSVNPSNRQIGYHTDWASSFPFQSVGLPDNYARPLPSLWAFGFEYNEEFLHWAGGRIDAGLQVAEEQISFLAAEADLTPYAYRRRLQFSYQARLQEVRRNTMNARGLFEASEPQ